MSKNIHRLELVLKKIAFIEIVVDKSGGLVKALEDEANARAAIMMHLTSIAEQFDKLAKNGEFGLLGKLDGEDVRGSYDVRNYIVHDYEGINIAIIEKVVRTKLPKLKSDIETILSELQKEEK